MQHNEVKADEVKRRNKIIYTFIYLLIIYLMALLNIYTGNLDFLNSSNTVFIDPTEFSEDFSTYELTHADSHQFIYTANLSKETFQELEGDEYKIIVNGIKDNAIKIWFNDQLITSMGDLEDGRSIIQSSNVNGSLAAATIQEDNVLEIQTFADYRTGIDDQVVISEKETGERAIRLLGLFNDQFVYLGLGLMLMSALFLLVIYFLNRSGNKMLLLLSLATVFLSFYFLDFMPLNYLAGKYIGYKKIFLLFLSLGVYYYGRSLYILIQNKYILLLSKIQLVLYALAMFIAEDMVQFKAYYTIFYFSLFVFFIFFLLSTFFNKNINNKIFIFRLHFITLIFLGIIRLDILLSNNMFALSMPVFFMFSVAFLPMIMTFDLLLEKQLELISEQNLKEIAHKQSLVDDLTGVWNKRYLQKQLHELEEHTIVALLDLDNLKDINDTHGHLAGDRMITHLADMMRNNLRKEDDICRYGGDEFVVIFKNCTMEQAVKRIEQIRSLINENSIEFNGLEISTTISVGLSSVTDKIKGDQVIEYADKKLYKAKENGRNRIEYASAVK